jgi:hypothetical protein
LEGLKATMNQKPPEPPSPPALDSKHPDAFCTVGDTCPTCGKFLVVAKEQYALAHQKGVDEGKTAGRNDVLAKLNQAAIDTRLVEPIEVVAARMAQMEAGEGDLTAQLLIVQGLSG